MDRSSYPLQEASRSEAETPYAGPDLPRLPPIALLESSSLANVNEGSSLTPPFKSNSECSATPCSPSKISSFSSILSQPRQNQDGTPSASPGLQDRDQLPEICISGSDHSVPKQAEEAVLAAVERFEAIGASAFRYAYPIELAEYRNQQQRNEQSGSTCFDAIANKGEEYNCSKHRKRLKVTG